MSPIVFFLVIKEVVLSNKYDGRQIKMPYGYLRYP